jgi:hypothetical protein
METACLSSNSSSTDDPTLNDMLYAPHLIVCA